MHVLKFKDRCDKEVRCSSIVDKHSNADKRSNANKHSNLLLTMLGARLYEGN